MRKVICAMIISVLLAPSAWAKSENLYGFVSEKYVVNVKIDVFSTAGQLKEIKVKELAKIFKEALQNRKSVNFNIVKKDAQADLVISGEIKDFIYSENDPIDILLPIGLIADAVTNKNYARLEFNVNVRDPKKNKVLWKKKLKATLTESNMSRKDSIPLIMKRAAKVFIRDCFSKPH